jgi:hypothetical protein
MRGLGFYCTRQPQRSVLTTDNNVKTFLWLQEVPSKLTKKFPLVHWLRVCSGQPLACGLSWNLFCNLPAYNRRTIDFYVLCWLDISITIQKLFLIFASEIKVDLLKVFIVNPCNLRIIFCRHVAVIVSVDKSHQLFGCYSSNLTLEGMSAFYPAILLFYRRQSPLMRKSVSILHFWTNILPDEVVAWIFVSNVCGLSCFYPSLVFQDHSVNCMRTYQQVIMLHLGSDQIFMLLQVLFCS